MEEVMLSALQHYVVCPRQCALIHIERVWAENEHTAEGRLLHEAAHSGREHVRDGIRVSTDVELHSSRLGLHGRSDIVEFHKIDGEWVPYPVEYKKGRPRSDCDADEVQLCGQALCLEEMTGVPVREGALFYGKTRHRLPVQFDDNLRKRTESVIGEVRLLLNAAVVPLPEKGCFCPKCSLSDHCMPGISSRAREYVASLCEPVE